MSLPSRRLILPIVVLLVASGLMFGVTSVIPAAHAVPGDAGDPACIAAQGLNPCLSIEPSTTTLPAPGGTLSLMVNFTEFPTFSAWDIAIKTNVASLKPTSITLVETFSGTSATFSNCLNGTGAGCSSVDGAGVAHSAVSSLSGSDAGNGTLFIVNYAVVAGPGSSVTYFSNPGVEDSSVSDPTGASVVDCATGPAACLTGSVSVTDFSVTASPTTVPTTGPGATGTSTITVTPLGGFTGTVNLSAGPKPKNTAVTATLASPSVTITSGAVQDMLTLSSTSSGTFTILVNGTSTGFPLRQATITLTVPVVKQNSSTSTTIVNEGTSTNAGTSFHDTATVTGVAGTTPTGTYTYKFFNNNACTGTALTSQAVTLSGGLVPNSPTTGPLAAGSYSFQGTYAGDTNYNPSTSACEPQVVGKATPTLTTSILSVSGGPVTSIIVGSSVTDQATLSGGFPAAGVTGTVSYFFFSNGACTGTGTPEGVVTVGSANSVGSSSSVTPVPAGSYSFDAIYSGDGNNNQVTSTCEGLTVQPASPTITSTVSSSAITIGGSVSDLATLSGGFSPTGTVTYNAYSDPACSVLAFGPNTVPLGSPSGSFSPTAPGTYFFTASYSGDANNNAVATACGAASETFTVAKATPVIGSTVTPSSITVGASASDLATVSGGFSPTGTVTYTAYSDAACTTLVFTSAGVPLGTPSGSFTPATVGSYNWIASYSGDANNNAVATLCGATGETLTVAKATPAITSVVSPASITIGGSASDLATVSGGFGPTGTVTYTAFSNAACTTLVFTSAGVALGTPSGSFTPATAGSYNWIASYSGDANNNAVATLCGASGETLTVAKATPSITTNVLNSAGAPVTSIVVGSTVTDQASLTSGFPASGVSGTVSYTFYANNNCAPTGTPEGTVAVGLSNSVGPSNPVTLTSTGVFSFNAMYSGDSNNSPVTSSCETLTVTAATPTITSAVTPASITIGGSASDLATVSGGFNPTGTVSYTAYSDAACSVVAFGPNVKPVGSASDSFTPTAPGTYLWIARYSGDANNNAIATACGAASETLTVGKASPQISSTVTPASITLGHSATDLATLTGAFSPTGSITYTAYSDPACTVVAFGPNVKPIGVSSDPFTPAAVGTYRWIASYPGDANNNGASTTCGATGEILTVATLPVPTLTTTVKDSTGAAVTSVVVGSTVHDTAVITPTSPSTSVTGMVTYNFFMNGACSGSAASSEAVTITSTGTVPDSSPKTISPVGSYSYQATYSGDPNNAGAVSSCEAFEALPASPTISSVVTPASITIGGSASDLATVSGGFSPTGTVTYTAYSNAACTTLVFTSAGVPLGTPSGSFTPATVGSYNWIASYSGDANNNGAATSCGAAGETLTVTGATPAITSVVSPATITIGSSASDLATVSGGFGPTGTVTYKAYSDSACTVQVFTDTEPLGSASAAFTPSLAGTYQWIATYNGDTNNSPASTLCGATGETLLVNPASPAITTTIRDATGAPVTSITVGNTVTDTATLTGGFPATGVSGTVSYALYSNPTCTGTGTPEGTVAVGPGNSVGASNSVTPAPAGSYSFNAKYSGDANNTPATSSCEGLIVNPVTTATLSSTVSPSTITIGGSATDLATLSGGFNPTGTVTYAAFSDPACTVQVFGPDTVPLGSPSSPFTPTAVGTYFFTASYSGDANNNAASTSCGAAGETLTVTIASPTIASKITPSTITLGQSATDLATLSGGFTPTGTVTYTAFSDPACSVVAFGPNVKPVGSASDAFTPVATGTYFWIAAYSGDANNNPASTVCGDTTETLNVVTLPTPVLMTTVRDSTGAPVTSVPVGTMIHDTATITPTPPATSVTGTVTYNLYLNSPGVTCQGSLLSTETVTITTTGTVPDSSPFTVTSPGSYSYLVNYSGDANNAPTSVCETFEVVNASPAITTVIVQDPSGQPVPTTGVTVGSIVHDTASIVNGFNPTGMVTYSFFNNGACDPTGLVTTQIVTVNPDGTVPPMSPQTLNTAGTFSFMASYSGDANNNPAASGCEVLIVNPASTSLATIIINDSTGLPVPASGVVVGTSVHDTATLSGGFNAGGTVTYSFFTNGGCTAGIGTVQTFIVPVAGGVVPPSPSVTPLPAGTYSFQAAYSGDINNTPSTSGCEVLIVLKATATISTTVTPPTIPIGGSAVDAASVTPVNGITPTGSVMFTVYSDTACSVQVFTDTEPLGNLTQSTPFTPTTAGTYQWIARYSGDSNYSPANSTCGTEPLRVTDFAVAASPTAVSVKVGVTGTSTISVTGIAGFTGNVTLGLSTSPGLSCTLTPSTIFLPPDGTATLSCSAAATGTYTAIVNGTSPGYPNESSHIAHVTFMVTAQDFTITASPNFIIAKTHPSRPTSMIIVTSVGGFSGPVTLSATSSPSAGITLTFSTSTLTVPAGGTASATLTIRVAHAAIVNPGTYIITITGTDGTSGPHSTTITLIIPASTSGVIAFPTLTWTHTLSVSGSGGTQTWTATVTNTLATAQYVQVVITGISTVGTHSFTAQSAVVLVAPGASQTITFSTPSGTFTSADIGLTFNFTAKVLFGASPALGSVSKAIQTGTFTIAA